MKKNLLLIFIVILGFIFRFYMLGSIPAGLTSDEANTGYDAYSVLLTGRDQWGELYPLISLKGFGDYRLPVYTYLVIPFIKIFDLSILAVRLPSAVSGVIAIILIFLITRKIFDYKTGVISAFLMAFSPWGVGLSRQGIESNLAMALFLMAFYLFLKHKDNEKFLYLSLIIFLLTIYTYTSYILFTPLALIILILNYRRGLFKIKKKLILAVAILIIGLLPLILGHSAGSTRFSQIGFTRDLTSIGLIDVLNLKIGSCNDVVFNAICRVYNNKLVTFSSVFFQNFIHHFSFDFLYLKGTSTQFSLLPERGLLYLYESIFLLSGLFLLFKKKGKTFIIFLLMLSVIPDSLSGGGHHSRSSIMLPFLIITESIGIIGILKYLNSLKNIYVKSIIEMTIFTVIFFSVSYFALTYFTYFKKHYSSYSLYPYKDLSISLKDLKSRYYEIYLSSYLNDSPQYIFYLFYNKYDPRLYQNKDDVLYETTKNGFIKITKLENINFTNFNFSASVSKIYMNKRGVLFIASPDAFPKGVASIAEFKDLSGGTVFKAVEYNELVKYYNLQ